MSLGRARGGKQRDFAPTWVLQKMDNGGSKIEVHQKQRLPNRGASWGFTLVEGKIHAKPTNGNGVMMCLAGETEELASSMGAQEFQIV